jgi:hypothetical protein
MTIQRSDQLNELFSALSKVQGKLETAKKDKSGYNDNYMYADLTQYIELSKELLAKHGLCILQIPESIEIVEVTKEIYDKKNQSYVFQKIMMPKQKITTWIGHESGQFISGSMEILVEKMAANSWGQSTGVAVSFARRYALAGSLGMSQEDNDNQLPKKEIEKSYAQVNKAPSVDYERIDSDKVNYLTSLLKDDSERLKKILVWAKVQKIEDLSIIAYTTAVNRLIAEQKGVQVPSNNDTNLISDSQVAFIKRLVTTERLNKILQDYNLNKLEEMNMTDYHKEYDKLRLEMTTNIEHFNITQTN